jgi:hypothetical protein
MILDPAAVSLPDIPVVWVAVGLALLAFGRRIFWLVLAALGFLAGAALAQRWLAGEPPGLALAVAAAGGVVGAVLAVVVQKLAVTVAGFLLGGAAGLWLAAHWGLAGGGRAVAFLALGGVAAVVALALFDAALVVLSSVAGAFLLLTPFEPGPTAACLLLLLLTVVGVAIQARRE